MVIYNIVVGFYGLVIRTASLRKEKAANWVKGRRDWRFRLKSQTDKLLANNRIWVHCASYGEFEQGRPLIEEIRKRHPEKKIILTFFSPSGYESFKDWQGADIICYLPLDTPSNAKDFLDILQPEVVIFIKYEFWLNYLTELKKRNIRTYLVSATFKEHHPFFKPYGKIFRRSLETFEKLFIQDKNSARLLSEIGIKNCEITGDTRFDRVSQIRKAFTEIPEIAAFKGINKLIVAGSTWPKDEKFVLDAFARLDKDTRLVIVPHDIEDKLIKETINKLSEKGITYCLYSKGIDTNARVLILDKMGLLSKVYYYADCAYIGGGFSGGLHNTLEAAVYLIPVTFTGKDHIKYNEAVQLIGIGAATCVDNEEQLATAFQKYLTDLKTRQKISAALTDYFNENSNVCEKILSKIKM